MHLQVSCESVAEGKRENNALSKKARWKGKETRINKFQVKSRTSSATLNWKKEKKKKKRREEREDETVQEKRESAWGRETSDTKSGMSATDSRAAC